MGDLTLGGAAIQFSDNGGTQVSSSHPLQVTVSASVGQPNSAADAYQRVTRFGGVAHNLHGTGVINLSGRIIGTAGVIGDTEITSVLILKNAGPATVILTGFSMNEDNATSKTITLTGSTSADTLYTFDQMINYAAGAQVQASVADTVVVWHGIP